MYYYLTLLFILIIFIVQLLRGRLLTSVTLFTFYYGCFFIFSPLLLGYHYAKADEYAFYGILSFFIGFCIMSLRSKSLRRDIKDYEPIEYNNTNFFPDIIQRNCTILFWLTIICLVLYLGIGGIIGMIKGTITSRSLLGSGGIFQTLFGFFIQWFGYSLVLLTVARFGKLNCRIVFLFIMFFAIQGIFVFTRANLLIVIGMLVVYFMRKETTIKQIKLVIPIVAGCFVIMTILIMFRVFGSSAGFKAFNLNYMIKNLANNTDFSICYESFAELVEAKTHITPLVYLKGLFAVIPRSIWASKPQRGSVMILEQLQGISYVEGGTTSTGYSILGLSYACFGISGIFLGPFIWSIFLYSMDNGFIRHINNNTDWNYKTFLYLLIAVAFTLQGFREGTDVAIMNFILNAVVLWIVSSLDILHMKLYLKK